MVFKKRENKKIKIVGIFLLVLVVLTVLGGMFRQYINRKWREVGRFTVIVVEENKLIVKSIDPITSEAVAVDLPADLQISTVAGRGEWKVGVLPKLADKYGNQWLGDSVANFLGISYTALGSELNWWDKISWKGLENKAVWKVVPLDKLGYITEGLEADSQKVLGLDSQWNNKVSDLFLSSELAQEDSSITVVNSTNIAGLGSKAARVLGNSGLRVTMVKSEVDLNVDRCELQLNKIEIETEKVKFIQDVFDCMIIENDNYSNGEMQLKIGKQFGRFLFGEEV